MSSMYSKIKRSRGPGEGHLVTARISSCRKAIFSQVSVSHSWSCLVPGYFWGGMPRRGVGISEGSLVCPRGWVCLGGMLGTLPHLPTTDT